jgi:hypothetical protein
MGRCEFRPKAIVGAWSFDQADHLRRASLLSETSPTTTPQNQTANPSAFGLALSIGAVGLFRSPNISSSTPMIPVTGLDAGSGKAGLIPMIGDLSGKP